MCTTPPKSRAIAAHRGLHTDTLCSNTTSMCADNSHTTPLATSQQPTNQQTNQPTNQPPHQPAKLSCARTNQATTNQPTQQPTKQPESQQPTNQQARYQCTRGGGGGGCRTWEEGGQSIPLTRTAAHCTTQLGGGGAREEGWCEGGTCTLDNPTPPTHMAGRREGVTHLPPGVTVYPLLDIHTGKKNQHTCKEERNTLPNLRQNKQGPHNPEHNMERGAGGLIA